MKRNEFGAELDRAGYAPSIMQPAHTVCCYVCGQPAHLYEMDRHEPWGAANRQKSKALGLWVSAHHVGCHEGPGSAHADGELARKLRKDAQTAAMLRYGWSREKWIEEFGKSELTEEEAAELLMPVKQMARRHSAGSAARELRPDPTPAPRSAFRLVDGPDLPF